MFPTSKTADLHLHTNFSDGADRPRRVVELARAAGLSSIAITDHDILAGYPEAKEAAEEMGLELIPGLEMSASQNGQEVHVLGLLIDLQHAGFGRLLTEQRTHRIARIKDMIARLAQLGLPVTEDEVFSQAREGGAVGRPHVAQAMVQHGYVATAREAFDRYIGASGPAYIPGSSLSPKEAIAAIREAGGVPSLAHPVFLKDVTLIEQMVRDGLVALEVYHSSHNPDLVKRYEEMADRLGLLRTGGSDYHGNNKEGSPVGSVAVPYDLVEALKQWQSAHPTRA